MSKQLKDEYKQRKFKIGVFQIRNTANGKFFVGSSTNLDAIWNRIKTELKFNGHRNETLQADWNKFGEEAFVFEILSELEQKDDNVDYAKEAKKFEEMFIDELQPFDEKGYHQKKRS